MLYVEAGDVVWEQHHLVCKQALFVRRGQSLPRHPLDRDGVERDLIDPREKSLRTSQLALGPIALGIFRHQHFEESLLGFEFFDHAHPPEDDHTANHRRQGRLTTK